MKNLRPTQFFTYAFAGLLAATICAVSAPAQAEDVIFNADLTAYASLACDNTVAVTIDTTVQNDPEPGAADTFTCTVTTNNLTAGDDVRVAVTADSTNTLGANDDVMELEATVDGNLYAINLSLDGNDDTATATTDSGVSALTYEDGANEDWFSGVDIDVDPADVNVPMNLTISVQLEDDAALDDAPAATYTNTVTFTISMI